MQKHNLNATYARLAPQFLAFLDKEEKKLRDEMERLKRKTTKDEKGGRFRLRRQRQRDGAAVAADNEPSQPVTDKAATNSAENQMPVGGTLVLPPDVVTDQPPAELPEHLQLLQRLQPRRTTPLDSEATDDVLGNDPQAAAPAHTKPTASPTQPATPTVRNQLMENQE